MKYQSLFSRKGTCTCRKNIFNISSAEFAQRVVTIHYNSFWDSHQIYYTYGVVGWCKGVMYLTPLGFPIDIGLQLGKACYPCTLGNVFISSLSFLFLFLPCPSLLPTLLSLLSLFSLFLGDNTKWSTRGDVLLNPNTINTLYTYSDLHWMYY